MTARTLAILRAITAFMFLAVPAGAYAQRTLHWDSIDVTAHLDAEGRLRVTEAQTMIFNGDWNGGERIFNIRPRQSLDLLGLERVAGTDRTPMVYDPILDDVDDYAMTGETALRWRSRLPGDPPFANERITYVITYQLSNIVLKSGDEYTLDHDFLFPDRQGVIDRARVTLTFDEAWKPQIPVQDRYTTTQVQAGHGYVLTIPLRYEGAGVPEALDISMSPIMVRALWALLAVPIVVLGWTFAREGWYGRFAPLETGIDETWIRENIVTHPAEVVAAAWDGQIDAPEVVALIARLVAEGKLKSVSKGKSKTMSLELAVDREKFDGYERALIDALFIKNRVRTNPELVKSHYRKTGFNPSDVIRKGLEEKAESILPPGRKPFTVPLLTTVTYFAGVGLVVREWRNGIIDTGVAIVFIVGALVLIAFARHAGLRFRANIQWGPQKAVSSLIPAAIAIGGAAWYLSRWVSANPFPVSDAYIAGVALIALSVLFAGVGALKSTQHRAALAFRKKLASGRQYFINELSKERPAMQDEWFPWVLAFGLSEQMDAWSATRAAGESTTRTSPTSFGSSGDGSRSSSSTWTGFGGGRSGGAGASAAWGSAMAAFAAPVAPPSSSSSGGGGGSSSSSGGSSGGGGGGGW